MNGDTDAGRRPYQRMSATEKAEVLQGLIEWVTLVGMIATGSGMKASSNRGGLPDRETCGPNGADAYAVRQEGGHRSGRTYHLRAPLPSLRNLHSPSEL